MKLIKQISTGKIVYREEPYHEKALVNGSLFTGIDVSDLEVHTQELTEEQYEKLLQDEAPYSEKRRREYPDIGDQLDMLWHSIDAGTLDKTSDFYTSLKATKDKYPKT